LLLVWITAGCDLDREDEELTPVNALSTGGSTGAYRLESPSVEIPEEPEPIEAEEFETRVDHRFFPLEPGTTWVYEGESDGMFRRDVVRVPDTFREILGVNCTAMVQEVFLDHVLVELTMHWFAMDRDGNVWAFGEESVTFGNGPPQITEDSWVAGEQDVHPWMILAAEPRIGDVYVGHNRGHSDVVTVLALDESVNVPAGQFNGCLAAREEDPDDPEDTDRIIYAPGTGLVSEQSTNGALRLTSIRHD
jgi:hypothetical protein